MMMTYNIVTPNFEGSDYIVGATMDPAESFETIDSFHVGLVFSDTALDSANHSGGGSQISVNAGR